MNSVRSLASENGVSNSVVKTICPYCGVGCGLLVKTRAGRIVEVRGDLGKAVQQLKGVPGKGLFVGGVKLPLALAELGLIDEYEFVVHPRLAGHGPTLFAGLSKHVDLKLVGRVAFGSGAVAMRYEPRR